jgi:hypothetical protein
MEDEERSHLETQYQGELEEVRNDVARLTGLLEQLLRIRDGEGTSTQPDEAPPASKIPVTPQI